MIDRTRSGWRCRTTQFVRTVVGIYGAEWLFAYLSPGRFCEFHSADLSRCPSGKL